MVNLKYAHPLKSLSNYYSGTTSHTEYTGFKVHKAQAVARFLLILERKLH